MGFTAWLGVVSGIVDLFAFMFALWVWMRSDMRIRELHHTLEAVHDISGIIQWETVMLKGEDSDARLRQAERAIGLAAGIHTLSSKFVSTASERSGIELSALVERGIIWTTSMLWNIEQSAATKEIWLATPDLKPDVSDPIMGAVVGNNVRKGKRYTYFVPTSLDDLPDLMARLMINLGIDANNSRLSDRITAVQVEAPEYSVAFGSGNIIFFFDADPMLSRGSVFREIVLTQVSERGIFWQECTEKEADTFYHLLRQKLEETRSSHMRP
jgi:hypothetical protein